MAEHRDDPDTQRPKGHRIARAAARRDGVLTSAHLHALGLGDREIARRADAGLLFRRHQGVYAVGRPELSARGERRAALDAMGDDAALSFATAAAHLGLGGDLVLPVHVTVPRARRPRPGIVLHRAPLLPQEVVVHQGLRVTSVARTILDQASVVDDRAVMQLCSAAASRGLYDRAALEAVLRRGRAGSARLRRVLALLDDGTGHTHEEFEHRFRQLLVRHRIRQPDYNLELRAPDGRKVYPDAAWLDLGLVVELDSRGHHDHEPGWFRDREKDLIYVDLRLECIRLTWRQVVHQETRTAAVLRRRVGTA